MQFGLDNLGLFNVVDDNHIHRHPEIPELFLASSPHADNLTLANGCFNR